MISPALKSSVAASLLLAANLISGCAVNPATGQRQLMLVSEGQEIAMGEEAAPEEPAEQEPSEAPPADEAETLPANPAAPEEPDAKAAEAPSLTAEFEVLAEGDETEEEEREEPAGEAE